MTFEKHLEIVTGVPGGLNSKFVQAFLYKTSTEALALLNSSKRQSKRWRLVVLMQEVGGLDSANRRPTAKMGGL
jgi:hypothetical protein